MKIVKISGYACGYHSGQEWSENYYIKKDTYEFNIEADDILQSTVFN